jgi:membrane-bound ClpP family serine protease
MKNKGLWRLLGFLLLVFGITSVVLQMVGTQWVFLTFLEIPGRLFAFVVKVLMILGGVLITVFANTDWDREVEDSMTSDV